MVDAANLPSDLEVLKLENNPLRCERLKPMDLLNKHLRETCSAQEEIGVSKLWIIWIIVIVFIIAGTR